MQTKTLTVLVTGATGNQGGAVARSLLGRGHRVIAFTRRSNSPPAQALETLGAHLAVGNFDDEASCLRALDGVDAVFAMSTPAEGGAQTETRQGRQFVLAAQRAGVEHFVYSSVACADQNTGIPHFESKRRVEIQLKEAEVPHTVIAPVFFMDNLRAPSSLPELKRGTLTLALPPTRPLQMVAVEDIGSFAALVIEQRQRFLNQRIDIAGDEVTGPRAAEVLSEMSSRHIEYREVSLEQIRARSEDFAAMFEWFQRVGYSVDIPALRQRYPTIHWKDFPEWARAQDWKRLLSNGQ